MFEEIRDFAIDDVKAALDTDDKTVRDERLKPVYEKVHEHFDEIYPDQAAKIDECMYLTQKFVVRRWLLDEQKRVDGRGMDEIRPLAAEVGLLPRVHGSGMFTRGQTQVLTVATLGSTRDNQLLDGIDDEESKRYIHHYNFPSYSVGETKPSRGPGRREIGHGALAERALVPVLPTEEEFPYAIRTVSETFESNGSTSQASICASTMSLMAAGVKYFIGQDLPERILLAIVSPYSFSLPAFSNLSSADRKPRTASPYSRYFRFSSPCSFASCL